jgi:hypothetical protein
MMVRPDVAGVRLPRGGIYPPVIPLTVGRNVQLLNKIPNK